MYIDVDFCIQKKIQALLLIKLVCAIKGEVQYWEIGRSRIKIQLRFQI